MDYYRTLGKHFGYPKCCTEWFVARLEGKVPFDLTDAQTAIDEGHGFVPCPSCAQGAVKNDIELSELIVDRQHPLPYPYESRPVIEKLKQEIES